MNNIIALPAFKDNYIWALHSLDGTEVIVVDPVDPKVVFDYLQKNKLKLSAILVTHHHWDHSGGVRALVDHFDSVSAYGPIGEKVDGIKHFVSEGDEIVFPSFQLTLKVLEIPGHTLGHVAYFNEDILFCGDTLFSCGCGRVFEGTAQQMVTSLNKLKALSPRTMMYCGHEYTLANIHFAQNVEPHNKALKNRRILVEDLRHRDLPSLPISMGEERKTNPFLRCEEPEVIDSVQKYAKISLNDPISVFAHLRQWKNEF